MGRPHTGRDLLLRARVSEREKARALHEATALRTSYTDYVRFALRLANQHFRKDPAACAREIARLKRTPRPRCARCRKAEGLLQVSGRGSFCDVCFLKEQLAHLSRGEGTDLVSDPYELPAPDGPLETPPEELSLEESGPNGERLSPPPSLEAVSTPPKEPSASEPLPLEAPSPEPESRARELWEALKPALIDRVSETNFEIWLSKVRPGRLEERALSLLVPTAYLQEYLTGHYGEVLEEVIEANGRGTLAITFVLVPTEEPKEEPKTPEEPTKEEPPLTASQRFKRIMALAAFAVGGSLAIAAQDSFADLPEAHWNELGQRLQRHAEDVGRILSHKAQARVCENFWNELDERAKTRRKRRYTTREDHIKRTLAELGKTGPG